MTTWSGGEPLNERLAWDEHIRQNGRRLFLVAYRILRDQAAAADACQQALCRAWACRAQLRDPGALGAWIHRAVTNECYGLLRKRKLHDSLILASHGEQGAGVSPPQQAWEHGRDLEEALAGLPAKSRTAACLPASTTIRAARLRTQNPEHIRTLQIIGRRYLELGAPKGGGSDWQQRMVATQVLLGTQDAETLNRLADRWLASREPEERLAGIVARGRLLLYGGGPPAISDFYIAEEPIRNTEGRRQQAEFYFRELQRWVVDLGHPLKAGRYHTAYFRFALRTAFAFKLAGLPERALQVYALALREAGTPPFDDTRKHVGRLPDILYRQAVLLGELGDRASAAAILKLLIEGDNQRSEFLHQETDELLVGSNEASGLVYDAAVKSLQSLRTTP